MEDNARVGPYRIGVGAGSGDRGGIDQALLARALAVKPGTYLVIDVDGTEKTIAQRPTLEKIYAEISTAERDCVLCDTVTLRMGGNNYEKDPIIMFVDESGLLDGLPVNPKATVLYLSRCKPGSSGAIHGAAVIVNDRDFL